MSKYSAQFVPYNLHEKENHLLEYRTDTDAILFNSDSKHVLSKSRLLAHSTVVSSREDSCVERFEGRSASNSSSSSSQETSRRSQCEACHAASGCCRYRNIVTKTNYPTKSLFSYFTYSFNMSSITILLKLFVLAVLLTTTTANTKLLIVGQSRNNNYKFSLAEQYFPEIGKYVKEPQASFYVFSQNYCGEELNAEVYSPCYKVSSVTGNFSTIIISQRGTDEMSFAEIEVFYNFLDKINSMLVIEIGDEAVQTRALLRKGSQCWGETSISVVSPNRAFLCNGFQPSEAHDIVTLESINLIQTEQITLPNIQNRPFWPCLFVSASPKSSKKSKQATPAPKVQEEDEEDEDVYDAAADNDDRDEDEDHSNKAKSSAASKYKPHKAPKSVEQKKLECKYRKSCYDTGKLPDIDQDYNIWPSFMSNDEQSEDEDKDDDDDDIDDDDTARITAMKLKCKYRLDCYKSKNIPLSAKEMEHNEKKIASTATSAPTSGKKKSLKDIAQKAVKKVKAAEEKAAARPIPKAVRVERKMEQMEDEMNKKLRCKYRKSCYETGILPPIQEMWVSQSSSENKVDEEEKDFNEMTELEQKFYCKYRKSCYSTGTKPEIQPEIRIQSLSDLQDLPDIVQTRKITIQEKCKYRKSCYKTGILPEIHPPVEYVVEQKHVSSVVPTSLDDLKNLCKYRKSCYEEIASSGTTEVVKTIRKRRLIEKEERKRRHRREKLRKRAKGTIEFQEEQDDYEDNKQLDEVEEKKKEEVPTHKKKDRKEKKQKTIVQDIVEKVPIVVQVQKTMESAADPQEGKKSNRKNKKAKQGSKSEDSEPEVATENIEEPQKEVEEVIEKTAKKSLKKLKTPKPEQVEEEMVKVVVTEVKEEPVKKEKKEKEKKVSKEQHKKEKTTKVKPTEATHTKSKDEDDEFLERQKQRDHCKYRKSCYDSGKRPVIDQTISTMYNTFNQHVDKVYEQRPKSESDQKLDCKYRKSCYDTGELPDLTIHQDIVAPKLEDIHDKKLQCKYRKSCYDDSIEDKVEKVQTQEEARKPSIQKVVSEPKVSKKSGEKKVEKSEEAKRQEKKQEKKKLKDDDDDDDDDDKDDDDKEKEEKKKAPHVHAEIRRGHDLDADEKLQCKYRKSCYGTVKPRSKNQDHSGSMARQAQPITRTKCNEYYLSCREELGLPPKEKAPMGPSGRKLCRKKKQ